MEVFTVVTIVWCSVLAINLVFGGFLIAKYQSGAIA